MTLTSGTYPYDVRSAADVAYAAGYGYLVGLDRSQSTGAASDTYARYVLLGAQAPADEFAIDASSGNAGGLRVACTPAGLCLAVETYRGASYAKSDIRGRLVTIRRAYLPAMLK